MIVTTGGRGFNVSGASSISITSVGSSSGSTSVTVTPNSSATIVAVSTSTSWLMLAITPKSINFLMISDTSRPIFSAKSLTVRGPLNSISVAIAASALRSASAFCCRYCSLRCFTRFFFFCIDVDNKDWGRLLPPFLFFLLRRSLLELRLSLLRLSLLRLSLFRLSLLRTSLERPLLRLSLLRVLLGRLLARSPPCCLPSDLRVGSEICT